MDKQAFEETVPIYNTRYDKSENLTIAQKYAISINGLLTNTLQTIIILNNQTDDQGK